MTVGRAHLMGPPPAVSFPSPLVDRLDVDRSAGSLQLVTGRLGRNYANFMRVSGGLGGGGANDDPMYGEMVSSPRTAPPTHLCACVQMQLSPGRGHGSLRQEVHRLSRGARARQLPPSAGTGVSRLRRRATGEDPRVGDAWLELGEGEP